jgi:hypothetical protein
VQLLQPIVLVECDDQSALLHDAHAR